MTKKELVEKYPKIFSTETDPRYPVRMFGIECGNGWLPLLDILCYNLQFDTDHNNQGANEGRYPQINVLQVKEKYGGLRFYVNGANDNQYGKIDLAKSLSYHICEDCGIFSEKQLTQERQGWIWTLCDNCWNKKQIQRSVTKNWLGHLLFSSWWFKKYMIKEDIKSIKKFITKLKNSIYSFLFLRKIN